LLGGAAVLAVLLGLVLGAGFGMLKFRARDHFIVDPGDDFFHDLAFRWGHSGDSRLFCRYGLLGESAVGRVGRGLIWFF